MCIDVITHIICFMINATLCACMNAVGVNDCRNEFVRIASEWRETAQPIQSLNTHLHLHGQCNGSRAVDEES